MGSFGPYVANGKAYFQDQDIDELKEISLGEMLEWVQSMIARHGAEAEFDIEVHEDYATYSITRAATPEEIAADADAKSRRLREDQERECKTLAELLAKYPDMAGTVVAVEGGAAVVKIGKVLS